MTARTKSAARSAAASAGSTGSGRHPANPGQARLRPPPGKGFARIEDAIRAIRAGKLVIVVDDEDRENEGDLTMAAEKVTPAAINFMATHGRGLICLPIVGERLDQLKIPAMVSENTSPFETAFAVSVEAKRNVSTGISAFDRAATVKTILDPRTRPDDLSRPGHMFPLRAREGGVLARAGQTEAAVDLARLAGLYPAGVICEIMNPDGSMARVPELLRFARKHGLPLITIKDLIDYRMRREKLVSRVATTSLPTRHGSFRALLYHSQVDNKHHLALVRGEVATAEPVLVRVHSECLTGDALGSLRCDCGAQLDRALAMIAAEGRGVLLYIRQEGRGIGLANKIRAYELQDQGFDTVEANERLGFKPDLRDYGVGAQILVDLGIANLRLMTNNPRKIVGLEGYGLRVVERVPLVIQASAANREYLATKRKKLGHLIQPPDPRPRGSRRAAPAPVRAGAGRAEE
ncbi:MAG: bifunctional 3,4-dihydroxy-2-butanone-4-phosphate synthase/GTP cyclohydrolase II [candidate division NC10 bacterium]|nr:bifunctional 3,4-dihydroxy-2-butanone-4-phosphate synthase/GTP cyclohydrolase II [candidate division NC10 bacterium]